MNIKLYTNSKKVKRINKLKRKKFISLKLSKGLYIKGLEKTF